MPDEPSNVIHVVFGRDGATISPAPDVGSGAADSGAADSGAADSGAADSGAAGVAKKPGSTRPPLDEREVDPLADLYTRPEVARVFNVNAEKLRYWDRSGFLSPTGRRGRRRYYTFQDLIALRVAKGLLEQGVRLAEVRTSVSSLTTLLPKVVRPLAELRIVADGRSVVVRSEQGDFEPQTGQLVLDFEVRDLRDDVVRVLNPEGASRQNQKLAYEHYLEGCRLDEDPQTVGDAEACYRRALELDPSLGNAFTNLGNIRFRSGKTEEAESLYKKALAIDPSQPEAHYNLGFLAYERGDVDGAVGSFERALERDPSFQDAHFNLAMALEEMGLRAKARQHWSTYLRLDPRGPWATIARRHLDNSD